MKFRFSGSSINQIDLKFVLNFLNEEKEMVVLLLQQEEVNEVNCILKTALYSLTSLNLIIEQCENLHNIHNCTY